MEAVKGPRLVMQLSALETPSSITRAGVAPTIALKQRIPRMYVAGNRFAELLVSIDARPYALARLYLDWGILLGFCLDLLDDEDSGVR